MANHSLRSVRQALSRLVQADRSCRAALQNDAGGLGRHTTGSGRWQWPSALQHGRYMHGTARAAAQAKAPAAVQAACSRAARSAQQWRGQSTTPEAANIGSIGISLSRFMPVSQSQRWSATQYRRIMDEMQVVYHSSSCGSCSMCERKQVSVPTSQGWGSDVQAANVI